MESALKYIANTHGGYEFDLRRVTVILGANGSGKSTLLRGIKDSQSSVYVEGGRTIKIDDVVQLNRQNFQQYQNLEQTLTQYRNKRKDKLADRVFDALMSLIKREEVLKDEHSDAVARWDAEGRQGDLPKREQPPLDRLFEQYSEVFPHLHVSYNKADGRVTVINDNSGKKYGPSGLSDGEKQVFSLMADMLKLEEEYQFVIVDEPELNLHPELAERLWALLESEYQDKSFVYATHSIQFALRDSVDALYVLSADPARIQRIEKVTELPRTEIEAFLGGVPGILNADTVCVTEGHEKSFDSIFYRWLFGKGAAEVFPAGGCDDVRQVVAKRGLWGEISSDIRMVGVVDADYRPDSKIDSLRSDSVITLELHEAESFLCLPEVIVAAAKAIGSQERELQHSDVENLIFSELEAQRLQIALRRSFAESEFTVRLSLERSEMASSSTKEEVMALMQSKSAIEVSKAVEAMSEKVFEERLDRELERVDLATSTRNVRDALRLLPGKELLAKLSPKAGCRNSTDLMRSVKRNLKPDVSQYVSELSIQLRTAVQQVTLADTEGAAE
jgi:ABC-type cobalamin/Fe3+-siderophores transport system ATPase subunit